MASKSVWYNVRRLVENEQASCRSDAFCSLPPLLVRLVVRVLERGHRHLNVRAGFVDKVSQAGDAEIRDGVLGLAVRDGLRERLQQTVLCESLKRGARELKVL